MTKGDIGTRTNELLAEKSTDGPQSVQDISSLRENIRPDTVMQTYVPEEPSWFTFSSNKTYVTDGNTYQVDKGLTSHIYGNARLDEEDGLVTPSTKPTIPEPQWDSLLGGAIWTPRDQNSSIVEPNGVFLVEDNIEDYVQTQNGVSRNDVTTYIQEQANQSFQAYQQQRTTPPNTAIIGRESRDVTERYSGSTRQAAIEGTRLG